MAFNLKKAVDLNNFATVTSYYPLKSILGMSISISTVVNVTAQVTVSDGF